MIEALRRFDQKRSCSSVPLERAVNTWKEVSAPRPVQQGILDSAKAGEPDRYLAALLAPERARASLLALAAFAAEIARIPLAVREPAMGEIRLQWWRDALDSPAELGTGSEVADAARAIAKRDAKLAMLLHAMIDGHAAELQADAFPGEDAFWEFVWRTEGAQFAAALHVLDISDDPVARAARAAGEAYGIARILFTLPRSLAAGRIPLPQSRVTAAELSPEALHDGTVTAKLLPFLRSLGDRARTNLQTARQGLRELPTAARVAFLPLALVQPYLRAAEASASGGFRSEPRIVPFGRVLRIAAAHWGVGV